MLGSNKSFSGRRSLFIESGAQHSSMDVHEFEANIPGNIIY